MQQSGSKKGQLTFVNIIGVLISFMIFFLIFNPIYQPLANQFIASLDITWQFYGITVIFIEFVPLIVIIALVLSILNYAQPHYG